MKTEQRKCCCGGLPALWWWLLALLGAGLLYLGMIANKQKPIEQDLTQRSTETLTKLGYDWVKPVVDQRGRDVYLSGVAPDEASRTQAIQNVQNLYGVRTVDASGLKVAGDPVVNTSTAANNTAATAGTLAVGTASGLITAGAEANNTNGSATNVANTTTPEGASANATTTPAATAATTPNAGNTVASTNSATAATDANTAGATAGTTPVASANTTQNPPEAAATSQTAKVPAPAANGEAAAMNQANPAASTPPTATNAQTPAATTSIPTEVAAQAPAATTNAPAAPATNDNVIAGNQAQPTVAANANAVGATPNATGTAGTNGNTTSTPSSEPIQMNNTANSATTPATEPNNAQALAPTATTANNGTATTVAPEPEPVVILDDKQQVCQNRFAQEMGDKTIQFNVNKAVINPRSYPLLDVLAAIARECAGVLGDLKVEVGGHTDSDGDEGYNQLLSEQRAGAVKQYLVKKGVDAALLTVKGYGESRPVAPNLTKEGRAQNRRIEFKLK